MEKSVRRPDLVRPWKPHPPVGPDDLPPDLICLLSLILGLVGMLAKSAIFSWLAAFACLSAVANVRKSEADYKQLFASVTFAITGVVMNTLKAGVHAQQGGP